MKRLFDKSLSFLDSGLFIITIGLFTLLPFVLLSFYNNICSDDFCYATKAAKLTNLEFQIEFYKTWTGRYSSTFFWGVEELYMPFFNKLIPIILIFAILLALFLLSREIFGKQNKKVSIVFTFIFFLLFFLQMPTIFHGVYMFTNIVAYQFANILLIFLIKFLIKFEETKKKRFVFLSSFSVFLIVGFNEVSMLITIMLLGIINLTKFFTKLKIDFSYFFILVFGIVCSIVSIIAPGNKVRSNVVETINNHNNNNNNLLFSLKESFLDIPEYLFGWLPFVLIFSILFFDYLNRNQIKIRNQKLFETHPIISLGLAFSIFIIGCFPVYWAVGSGPPERTENVIYFCFLLSIFHFQINLYLKNKSKGVHFILLTPWLRGFLIFISISFFYQPNNVRTAYADLFRGRAKDYDRQVQERSESILKSNCKDCILPVIKDIPKSLFKEKSDIKKDPQKWRNKCFCSFHKIESVRLKE